MFYCCTLNCKPFVVAFQELIKSFHICRNRVFSYTLLSAKYTLIQIIGKALSFFFLCHIGSQKCNTPCAALSGCLHNGNRCIDGCCHDALSDYRSLKQTAVAVHLVDLYAFLFEQDIQTIL